MKILFLSRWFPLPVDNGSKLRILNLLKGLTGEHEVHLISFSDELGNADIDGMRAICQTVKTVQWREFQPNSLKAVLGIFSFKPRSLVDTYSVEMEDVIRQTLSVNQYDLVITTQWQMTAYRHLFSSIPALFEEIEVGVPYGQYQNADSVVSLIRTGLTWLKLRHYLKTVLTNGQPCTVVSEKERSLLTKVAPHSSIYLIPNGVSLEDYGDIHVTPNSKSLIFTGSFRYYPNYEAMIWFIEKVLPLVQKEVPDIKLIITGDSAGLKLPQSQAVIQTGFVDQLYPLIAKSWISVVPLLVGGGTRLKILEAMALGTPVVSTSKGAEGLDAQNGKHLLISDHAGDFAVNVIKLLGDGQLREQLAENGYNLVREQYDWTMILPRFLSVVEKSVNISLE